MSSLQCLKRVHLEINRKELAHVSKATEAVFALGHEVGDMAIQLYGQNGGTFIEYNGGNFAGALSQTAELMSSMFRAPVFEATLQYEGVLVREVEFEDCNHGTVTFFLPSIGKQGAVPIERVTLDLVPTCEALDGVSKTD